MNDDVKIELNPSMHIGVLRRELQERKMDVRRMASYLSALRKTQIDAGLFVSHDAFTEGGSSPEAVVLDEVGHRRKCVMWNYNHYLGLSRHPKVVAAAMEAVREFGTGCGTSSMVGGQAIIHRELERELASFLGTESALLFPTGFTANLGGIGSLVGPGDVIFSDAENHASIIEGCRISRAKVIAFEHNSIADLASKLREHRGQYKDALVVVESAYSMSGDLAPLAEIVALKEQHDFLFFVDEAHSFGFYGPQGRGRCHELGIAPKVDFLMSTMSKSLASVGGFIAMEERFRTLMTWTAKAYLFQATAPPADAAAALAALRELRENPEHAARLHANNEYFRSLLRREGFDLRESRSPIVPVYIPDHEAIGRVTTDIFQEGIFTVAILYPAVSPTGGRLRFNVNATHTREQIEFTVDVLSRVCRRHGVL